MEKLIETLSSQREFLTVFAAIYVMSGFLTTAVCTRRRKAIPAISRAGLSLAFCLLFLPFIAIGQIAARGGMFVSPDPALSAQEAEESLKSLALAQLDYFAEHNRWAGQDNEYEVFDNLGWSPPPDSHYAYYCGKDYLPPAKNKFKFDYPFPSRDWPYAIEPSIALGDFICMAAGNNDADDFPDVWAVNRDARPVHLLDDETDSNPVEAVLEYFGPGEIFKTGVDGSESDIPSRVNITINIPAYRLDLYYGDYFLKSYTVGVGRRRYKTPRSTFYMKRIEWNPWWYPPASKWAAGSHAARPGPRNPLGPVKMVLGHSILIHGTNKPESVGHSSSHGCIRMLSSEATDLAYKVMALTGARGPVKTPDEYAARRRRTYRVFLNNPVMVKIVYNRVEIDDDWMAIHPDPYRRQRLGVKRLERALADKGFTIADLGNIDVYDLIDWREGHTRYVRLKSDEEGI